MESVGVCKYKKSEHRWVLIAYFFFVNSLRRIMKTSHHAGVESIIIKNIRNQVELCRKVVYKTIGYIQESHA